MNKKIVGGIVGLVIVAIGIFALWQIGPSLYDIEEPEKVSTAEDTLLYEEDMNEQPLGIERYIYTFNKTEGKYIWLDRDTDTDIWDVYSVSKESMEARIAGIEEMPPTGTRVSDTDTIKKCAELIVNNFGTKKEKRRLNYIVSYSVEINITCLNDARYEGPTDDTFKISPCLNDDGLVLSYENVSTHRIMADPSWDAFIAEVTADVTCVENSGKYKDVTWIPAEGESSEVTFAVEFDASDSMAIFIGVFDIGVIE